ncbi:MAG: ACT domain-containing protein [Ruminococcaceae bacterium]|nr:ACT domain-containing protein [Oscillospiraceae bacterium]
MRAVITVVGKDKKGIIAKVSGLLFETDVNILDISQTIMQDMFTMVMLVDISTSTISFDGMVDRLNCIGNEVGVKIQIQHEDIFNSMHKI